MYEVAERFYMQLIPQAREIAEHAEKEGQAEAATTVRKMIDEILARPEHQWFESQLSKRGEKAATPPANGTEAGATPPETPPDAGAADTPKAD